MTDMIAELRLQNETYEKNIAKLSQDNEKYSSFIEKAKSTVLDYKQKI